MNPKLKRRFRSLTALASACILSISVLPAHAEETIDSLRDKTSTLQNELNGLNTELSSISADVDNILTQITETTAQVEQTKTELGEALANEEQQYNDMKMRIRYMYEEGKTAMLDTLFSAISMADFLNKADFITKVSEYDRAMLEKLQDTREEIAAKEQALELQQQELLTLQAELTAKKDALASRISTASGELSAYSAKLEQAIAAEKAAQEALAKKAEEEKQAALEQAQKEEAEQQAQQKPSRPDPDDSGNSDHSGNSHPADQSDLDLFAAILQCEAGTRDYDALLAVATVIMNRMESSKYPDTLHGVIYQSGQFSPTWNGSLDKVLKKGAVSLCYTVASDALGGARHPDVRNCYQFRASYTGHQGIVIGGNVFF